MIFFIIVIFFFVTSIMFLKNQSVIKSEVYEEKASSSSSSASSFSSSSGDYDVFLSFRGEDTRYNFTSHLHKALSSKKISTFIDNDLKRGDEISEALLNAIEESKIAVIVFSKEYATSRWCLEELAKIIECNKIVVPIFYHVDPSDVRNQTGTFKKAFLKNEKRFQRDKVLRWRSALTKAANRSGFHPKKTEPESTVIDNVVKYVLEKLNQMSPSDHKDLVGIEPKIEKIESLLRIESKDIVNSVGIWGMGGIGKTTLARAVFTKLSSQFESVYFQRNVKEELEKHGSIRLSQDIFDAILEDRWAILESAFTKNRLSNKKVLIVFDDVTHFKQKEELIGCLECFGSGSRIIITSRDKQVLKNCGVHDDNVYEVKALLDNDALKLFSCRAFKLDHPAASYMDLSKRALKFAQGVPLALEVLGASLFEKTNSIWESALNELERNPKPEIQDVLKISYDGLNDHEKSIFLDIACFFKGASKNMVIEINGFESNIENLIDKSLITIERTFIALQRSFERIEMHDLIQQMGQKIVEEESKDRSKRSRLWCHDEISFVLRSNTGAEAIECISLDTSKIEEINLNRNAFWMMQNLRFLDFRCSSKMMCPYELYYCDCSLLDKDEDVDDSDSLYCPYCSMAEVNENKVNASQGLEFSSSDIRYFRWFGYPLDSLPSNFKMGNLVVLIMPGSKIKHLWNGRQHLKKLKHINLAHSKCLIEIPDLSSAPNLESLNLEGCASLTKVDLSVQHLKKLVILNLKGCKNVGSLPTNFQSKLLEYLILSGCSNLKEAPKITCNVIRACLDGTAITKLPLIEHPSRLEVLNLEDCLRLESLSSDICELKTLRDLNLTGCSNLHRFPVRELHSTLSLHKLSVLSLRGCRRCQDLVDSGWPFSSYLRCLYELDLSYCEITRLPDSLGQSSTLYLNLRGNKFERIPSSIKDSTRLHVLDISDCKELRFLPEFTPSFEWVKANNCTSLEYCSDSLLSAKKLNFGNCSKLDNAQIILKAMEDEVPSTILLPGNEIPKCFSFQNEGSSITLELPLDYLNDNETFLNYRRTGYPTLTVCLVVTFPDHGKIAEFFFVPLMLIALDQYGEMEVRHDEIVIDAFECDPLMSDHVILAHYYDNLLDRTDRHITVDFSGEHYNVKKCGLKLYFKDGIKEQVKQCEEHLNLNMEGEPQPKRQKL